MKNKIITTSRFGILALAVGSFSFAGLAMAQNPLSAKDRAFMKKAAKGGMMEEWSSDKAYMNMMVKDHEEDLAEFKQRQRMGAIPT
jgi:hypothetical protein